MVHEVPRDRAAIAALSEDAITAYQAVHEAAAPVERIGIQAQGGGPEMGEELRKSVEANSFVILIRYCAERPSTVVWSLPVTFGAMATSAASETVSMTSRFSWGTSNCEWPQGNPDLISPISSTWYAM
jgi:hypothetical protein